MKEMREKRLITDLVSHITHLRTPEKIEEFLREILTTKELKKISKRVEIIKYLKYGTDQFKITGLTDVAIGTVTKWAKELKKGKFKQIEADF